MNTERRAGNHGTRHGKEYADMPANINIVDTLRMVARLKLHAPVDGAKIIRKELGK